MLLVDKFNRPVELMEIAVSLSCQYNCVHCCEKSLSEQGHDLFATTNIVRFINVMAKLGLQRVRLSGGEPLMRPDIIELVTGIAEIKTMKSVSLVTNGKLLGELGDKLNQSGLGRLFLTLPTLDEKKFKKITGFNDLPVIVDGIESFANAGKVPVSIRFPLLSGVNEDEIESMISWAATRKYNIYFSCKMATETTEEDILSRVRKMFSITRMEGVSVFNNPWKLEGTETTLKIITPDNASDCGKCNRLWLSADGVVSMCNGIISNLDLNPIFEYGAQEKDIEELAVKIALNKPIGIKNCGRPSLTHAEK